MFSVPISGQEDTDMTVYHNSTTENVDVTFEHCDFILEYCGHSGSSRGHNESL